MWTSRRNASACFSFPQCRQFQTCPFLCWRWATACLHIENWIQENRPSAVSHCLPSIVCKWNSISPDFAALFSIQSSGRSVAGEPSRVPSPDGHSHGAPFQSTVLHFCSCYGERGNVSHWGAVLSLPPILKSASSSRKGVKGISLSLFSRLSPFNSAETVPENNSFWDILMM